MFGAELPLSIFIDAPTPLKQAEIILSSGYKSLWETAVPLKATGEKDPFFCVHPIDGNVLCYNNLASAMGDAYPLYGLQAKGLDGIEDPHTTVPEMAQHYLSAIKEIQPRGPYNIGGWSAGGVVAYEIAQLFKKSGEEVNLMIIDSVLPGQSDQTAKKSTHIKKFVGWCRKKIRPSSRKKAEATAEIMKLFLGDNVPSIPLDYCQASTIREAFGVAVQRYIPQEYQGEFTLILTSSYNDKIGTTLKKMNRTFSLGNIFNPKKQYEKLEKFYLHDPSNWQKLASRGVKTICLPCDHHNLLDKENCYILSREIMDCIK